MALSGTYFDANYYITQYADVAANWSGSALEHYVQYGAAEGRAPSSWFNAQYYRANGEAAIQSMTALEAFTHYETYGYKEGRTVSSTYANFDEAQYLADYADLGTAGITELTALNHYLMFGAGEGRTAKNDDGTVIASGTGTPGSTFALTTSADVLGPNSTVAANQTTSNDDSIYGLSTGTLQTSDILDAGAGNDLLVANIITTTAIAPTLTSIESVTLQNATSGGVGTAHTFSAANTSGMTSFTWKDSADTAADTHNATNLASTVSVGINNSEGAAHIYTFSYSALTGTADSVTLNTTSIGTATGAVTITDATATATADTGAETVVINNTAAASTLGSLAVTDTAGSSLNTLTVNASAALTITGSIDFEGTATGTIDASGSTAATTLTASGGEAITFTGGSGNDTITVGAANDTLSGGAGNDTFTIGTGNDTVTGGDGNDTVVVADAAITTNDSINFGDGTVDTLLYTDVTALTDAGVTLTNAQISAMTGITAVGSAAAVTAIDCNYFDQSIYVLQGNLVAAVTASDIDGDTIVFSGNGITGVNGDALTLSGALPGQSVTLQLAGAAAVTLQGTDAGAGNTALTVSSAISTVNIVSTTTGTASVTNIIQNAAATTATHTIDNVSAQNFVITGDQALTIGTGLTAGFTNAVNLDATGLTGVLNVVGSASADVIKGGSAADIIDGEDGADVLTGGDGADTFVFVTTETGNAAPSATNFETITDFAKSSDIIDWSSNLTIDVATATAVAGTAQVSALGIATFHSSDNTLALKMVAAVKGFDAAGDFCVFEHDGATYMMMSGDANGTLDAADTAVKLSGVTGVVEAVVNAGNNVTLS